MKIISKFRDYYDGMARYGIDDTLLFVRTQELIEESVRFTPEIDNLGLSSDMVFFNLGGEVLPGVMVRESLTAGSTFLPGKVIYSYDELKEHRQSEEFKSYRYFNRSDYSAYKFTECPFKSDAYLEMIWGFKVRCGQFTFKRLVNPRLLDYNVESVVCPYELHRRLSALIANKVRPEVEALPISDLERVAIHGFDKKISFRKRSSS